MHLDHLYLRDEVVALTRVGDTLRLSLRWRWEDLPYLLTLPTHTLLRWAHIDDPMAGVPVTLVRWRWQCAAEPATAEANVELHLRLTHSSALGVDELRFRPPYGAQMRVRPFPRFSSPVPGG